MIEREGAALRAGFSLAREGLKKGGRTDGVGEKVIAPGGLPNPDIVREAVAEEWYVGCDNQSTLVN